MSVRTTGTIARTIGSVPGVGAGWEILIDLYNAMFAWRRCTRIMKGVSRAAFMNARLASKTRQLRQTMVGGALDADA